MEIYYIDNILDHENPSIVFFFFFSFFFNVGNIIFMNEIIGLFAT